MRAVFIELPAFERHREGYLDDASFGHLQAVLMASCSATMILTG